MKYPSLLFLLLLLISFSSCEKETTCKTCTQFIESNESLAQLVCAGFNSSQYPDLLLLDTQVIGEFCGDELEAMDGMITPLATTTGCDEHPATAQKRISCE